MNATNNISANFDWNALFFPSEEETKKIKEEIKRDELIEIGLNPDREYKSCWKCGGVGKLDAYTHVSHGICFQCDGTGKLLK